ncbi:MAG: PKD domain-containing protein, partial [Planctomycetota bacterium]
ADPDPVYKNAATTLSGSFTDPGTLDLHEVTIDWGDGTPITTLNLPVGDRTFDAAHTFASTGAGPQDVYTVTVTVTDDDTGDDVETTTVTVVNGVLIDGFSAGDAAVDLDDGEILEQDTDTGLPPADTHGGVRHIQADWQGPPTGPAAGDFGDVAVGAGNANITLEGDPRLSFNYGRAAGTALAWAEEDCGANWTGERSCGRRRRFSWQPERPNWSTTCPTQRPSPSTPPTAPPAWEHSMS